MGNTKEHPKNIILEIAKLKGPSLKEVQKIFHRYPKGDVGLFSRAEVLRKYQKLNKDRKIKLSDKEEQNLLNVLKTKRTRTLSGVTVITVLTKPYPCPGKCIFCPSDVRMPKSYLSSEPGAQRALQNKFDPYMQTYNRLLAYRNTGHPTDKVELIILGGTWSSYPESYQIWFVKRCFDAMNNFDPQTTQGTVDLGVDQPFEDSKIEEIKGTSLDLTYNKAVLKATKEKLREMEKSEKASWDDLFKAHKINETAKSRCVGLVVETRPDEISVNEIIKIRKLGGTKVQLGVQSLNDKILKMNKRGHTVETTKRAFKILRQAGFKIHAHWMPNLYGSTPEMDILDFKKMFEDNDFKPDELKIYPCSLIASAELMRYYKKGLWKPYTEEELLYVLKECVKLTPLYCRITRIVRDIGSQDIIAGNKKTNFRQIVEEALQEEGFKPNEIRSREIRDTVVSVDNLRLDTILYSTSVSEEYFIQFITKNNQIAGFLRLSLPSTTHEVAKATTGGTDQNVSLIPEPDKTAIIREIHIYGPSIKIGERKKGKPQHLGLGKKLIQEAIKISKEKGYKNVAVISAVGTREYYKKHGFRSIPYGYYLIKR